MGYQSILDAVRSLPVDEQVRLVDQIQEDLEAQASDADLTPAQIQEIRRRIAAYDADPSIGIPWEEFEAHIARRAEESEEGASN